MYFPILNQTLENISWEEGDDMGSIGSLLMQGTMDTLLMVFVSLGISYLLGLPLGVLLILWEQSVKTKNRFFERVLSRMINLLRSIPFIILLTLLIPFTRFMVGTSIGVVGMIVPLSIAAIPFVARLVEQILREVHPDLITSIQVMGASKWQVVVHVYLGESIPALIRSVGITAITLIGYSAMAGATGGGGLGDIAIRYGYYNYRTDVMLYTVVILIILVEGIQVVTNYLAKKQNHIQK